MYDALTAELEASIAILRARRQALETRLADYELLRQEIRLLDHDIGVLQERVYRLKQFDLMVGPVH